MYQDHAAHIQVHMAMAQDPKIQQMVGQSPFASAIQNAMSAHVTEHIAMQYRVEIQKKLGVELPDPEAPLPEDVEREVSRLAAQAADKLLKGNQAEAAQQQAQQQAQDPLTQIQRAELELKARELKLKEDQARHNALLDVERFKMESAVKAGGLEIQKERLDADMQRDAANISARMATQLDTNARREKTEGAKLGVKIASELAKGANVGRATTPKKES
jgi:hypothetical protein